MKQWTTSYKAPAYYLNDPPPKPSGFTGGSGGSTGGSSGSGSGGSNGSSGGSSAPSSSVSLGPIVGGVVGVLAVIGVIAGFLIYRRRQNKKIQEIQEQVSQQKMAIEAERAILLATQNSNNRRNDGSDGSGSTGDVVGGRNNAAVALTSSGSGNSEALTSYPMVPISHGGDNSMAPTSYPMPPTSYPTPSTYYPNSNSDATTAYKYEEPPSPPHLQHTKQKQFAAAVSSPAMSSPALRKPYTAGNNSYSPQNPQLHYNPMFQTGVSASGPQEYFTPTGRAPHALGNEPGIYHEQESDRVRQNLPQGEISGYQ